MQGFVATECDPCVFTRRETVQTPSGPRQDTLIIGCYVDNLFTLYSHDDKHLLVSLYPPSPSSW